MESQHSWGFALAARTDALGRVYVRQDDLLVLLDRSKRVRAAAVDLDHGIPYGGQLFLRAHDERLAAARRALVCRLEHDHNLRRRLPAEHGRCGEPWCDDPRPEPEVGRGAKQGGQLERD